MGMALGPIPWISILEYAQYSELEPSLMDLFLVTIRAMDRTYLDWVDKKQEANKPKPKKGKRK